MQTNRGSVSASKLHMCWKARQVGRASRAAASGGGGGGGGKLGWGRKAAPRDPKDSDKRRSKIAPAPAAKSGGVGGWGQEQALWPPPQALAEAYQAHRCLTLRIECLQVRRGAGRPAQTIGCSPRHSAGAAAGHKCGGLRPAALGRPLSGHMVLRAVTVPLTITCRLIACRPRACVHSLWTGPPASCSKRFLEYRPSIV